MLTFMTFRLLPTFRGDYHKILSIFSSTISTYSQHNLEVITFDIVECSSSQDLITKKPELFTTVFTKTRYRYFLHPHM
jgi:hypothetical protein